jgi:tetratricopeptide (TPR) repeat protein
MAKNSAQNNRIAKSKPASKIPLRKKEITADPEALKRLKIMLGIIIAAFAFLLYAQSINFSYTLDDGTVIRENKVTRKGISSIPTILTHGYWYGFNESKDAAYRPASLIMFAMEYQLFNDNPKVSHFINVLLYALSCWLVYLLLCKIFENQNLIFPFVCALLYVAHPIHTEVVDSIKSRDEILCFLFGLTAALSFIKYYQGNNILYIIIGGICFFLSMLSKETGVSFLILLPLILFMLPDTNLKKIGIVVGVLIVLVGGYIFIRSQILESITTKRELLAIDNTMMATKSWISREATAFYILLRYIFLLILPHPLSYDYSYSQIKLQTLSDLPALAGIAVYFGLGIYALIKIRTKEILAFAIILYLLPLAAVCNIFFIIGSTMAERFMYIPSLAFCIILTYLLIKLTKTESIKSRFNTLPQFFSVNYSLFIIVFIITGLYSIKTFSRSQCWKDNIELFGTDVENADGSARAHYNWGSALLLNKYPEEKNVKRKEVLLDQAIVEFNKSLKIFDIYPDAYLNLGLSYMDKENNVEAIRCYEIARQLYPKPNPKVFNNLGLVYGKTGQFQKALSILDSALKYEDDFAEAHNNRGNALAGLGRFEEAIPEFQMAIEQNKKYAEALRNLGSTYGNLKNYPKAIDYFSQSYKIDSTDVQTVYFLGLTYKMSGDSITANPFLEKANRMKIEQQK